MTTDGLLKIQNTSVLSLVSLETVSLNWRDFNTSKRWIAQCQMKNDDKIIPAKTEEAMHTWIVQFIKFHKMTPDEFIEEAIDDPEKAGLRLDDFYRYKKQIIDRNSCITGIYGTLRGFYRRNKVNVQDISSPKFSPRQVKITDANYPLFKIIEIEQNGKKIKKSILNRQLIREFASHLNYRDQCLHLCIMSSGLDSNDILKLTIGDILRQEQHSRHYLNDVRNKTFMEYKDFFSTEATNRVRLYIKRERKDSLDDEPIFVTSMKSRKAQFKKKTGMTYRLGDTLPKPTRLKSTDLSDAFRDAQMAMGIPLQKGKQSPLRPKRWRKVFKTAASNAHLDRDIIKIMLGQSGDQSQTYEEDDRNTMEYHYELLEPKVTLYKDEDFEQEEVQKLKKQLELEQQSNLIVQEKSDKRLERLERLIDEKWKSLKKDPNF